MGAQDAYVSLIASLPRPERLFEAKQPPLSRIRLDQRLALLTPKDRDTLCRVERLMSWHSYALSDTDYDSKAHAKAALTCTDSRTILAILRERVDMRTVIAALRMRRDGLDVPAAGWSHSPLTRLITANWSDAHFKLDQRFPWLPEAATLLNAADPLALERHILDVTYTQLKRRATRHHFDFEAVVIYVLKWSIFDRWVRSDARAAQARFESLAQAALGDFADLDLIPQEGEA